MAKVKNPNRVKAGKKAWAKKSAASKAKSVRVLKGANPKTGGSNKGGKKGGSTVAKKKRTRSKQGVVSWAVNMVTLGIAGSNVLTRIAESLQKDNKMEYFARRMIMDHTGADFGPGMEYMGWDMKNMIRGYAPMAGAYAFKTGMTHVLKKVKIQSLIPGR